MNSLLENISQAVVNVPVTAVRRMLRLVRLLDRLSRNPHYRKLVYAQVPESARFDPGHDAVMMCYDFHLVNDIPKLIEVNTNAGGSLLAYLAHNPSVPLIVEQIPSRLKERLLQTFANEIAQYTAGQKSKPERILILDESPQEQHLYPEMCAFAELFRAWGVPTEIVSPEQLEIREEGVSLKGQQVDFIYNRHCDFYLETDVMAELCKLYLAGKICLSPNPHMYGLLADKRRMPLWANLPQEITGELSGYEEGLLKETILPSVLLADLDLDEAWSIRKQRIFKPVDSFGSRGVLHGEKISRKRFNELPPQTTLVQELARPSMTDVEGAEPMKTDLRVYAYRDRVLGMTARLYRGQVTNLRTPGGGFSRIRIV